MVRPAWASLLFKCPSSLVRAVIGLIASLSFKALSFLWAAFLSHLWRMDFSAGLMLPKISISVHISHFSRFQQVRLAFLKTSLRSPCWADIEHSALLCFSLERLSVLSHILEWTDTRIHSGLFSCILYLWFYLTYLSRMEETEVCCHLLSLGNKEGALDAKQLASTAEVLHYVFN